ncbi:TraR/DksA family transcriptional regulator [Streptomyces sp. Je 1-4]|uniref:TraR/DksA family transcriptional regulator n=1 Tax=Streptomyces TaxID=1883 RepID=UPI00140EAA38|nr:MULTISPECIES: TraR/DksA C4-type zinc finger protein [unclassified Streptomyces]QIK09239.1 histone H1-like repetitive region-containing protein [Streptomyces sp. ID38640]UYB42934.1 TraR/DksA family transcriptional regulator [Streptomyces sp. Je 1-4]UZQ39273.1 TraR/DksA family transcriptional regulator [Streptomyces sp. Je 1-4] [Streptomyces sp. Je 1-4 4N24]UZQ46690.1 TraR/DksA family transcriptional regulator [Streptomyces sp. Je 1-4] [Streptomyces sp. Je 1-4 4N24_ara]
MVAKKTAAEKSTTPADEAVAKQPAAKKTAPKKAAAKKTAAGTTTPEKATAKKAAPKRAAAKKTAAKKTVVKKTAAKKAANKAPAKTAAVPAKKTGAKTVVAKKTAAASATAHGNDSAVPMARVAAAPDELAVRPGEDPWTPAEVAEARTELMEETSRLRLEIVSAEDAIAGLMRDSGDGAGDDEADTGSKNITREHELALASNAREMLHQTERALGRLDAGTYGLCENCGNPIGKARMQAFPRATLCVECKQQQERR